MDCGDGVTVNIFKEEADGSDNGSPTLYAERSVTPFEIDENAHHGTGNEGKNMFRSTRCSEVQVQMVHPRGLEILAALQDGISSSDSSSNSHTDICTLEVNESHYGMETKCENKDTNSSNLDNSGSSIDAPDFTVIHAPGKIRTKKENPSTATNLPQAQEQMSTTVAPLTKLIDELPKLFDHLSHTKEQMVQPIDQLAKLDDNILPILEPLPLPEDPPGCIQYMQSSQPEDNLNKPQQPQSLQKLQHRESLSGAFEESTEVLLVHSSEYNNGKSLSYGHAFSGTDSDVEVLMSEEIIESDWSAGATATDDNGRTPDYGANESNAHVTSSQSNKNNKPKRKLSSTLKKPGDSTDQELSVEEFSYASSSLSTSDELSPTKMKQIIREQRACINQLQSKIEYYQRAQQAFFRYVESWRLALEEDN